jgi:hypothetical protein
LSIFFDLSAGRSPIYSLGIHHIHFIRKLNTVKMSSKKLPSRFGSIHEAVKEHRLSMLQRPKSAGTDRARKNLSPSPQSTKSTPRNGEELHRTVQTIEFTSGLDTFVFPTPSPRPPQRSTTFQGIAASPNLSPSDQGIGLAIGSPSQALFPPGPTLIRPVSPFPKQSMTEQHRPEERRGASVDALDARKAPAKDSSPLKKPLGWKAFSNIFRKPSMAIRNRTRPIIVDTPPALPPKMSIVQSSSLPPTPPKSLLPYQNYARPVTRDNSSLFPPPPQSESAPCTYAKVEKMTLVSHVGVKTRHMPRRESSLPPLHLAELPAPNKEQVEQPIIIIRSDSPLDNFDQETPATPKLELDLPSPHLERYSVMFDGVLHRQSFAGASLMERRQSKFSTVPDHAEVPSLQRSVSPLLLNVPGPTAINRPRPIRRSNTAPPGATSPVGGGFAKSGGVPRVVVESPQTPYSVTFSSDGSVPQTPTTINTCTDTSSILRDIEEQEPVWEMLTSAAKDEENGCESPLIHWLPQRDDVQVARRVSVSRTHDRAQSVVMCNTAFRPRVVNMSKNRRSTIAVVEMSEIAEVAVA